MINEMTNDEINLIVAESVGDNGFEPSRKCPQGHYQADEEDMYGDTRTPIGGLCPECIGYGYTDTVWANDLCYEELRGENKIKDKSWHPEWRIGRGEPKNFCNSLDKTINVIDRGLYQHIEIEARCGYESWGARIYDCSTNMNGDRSEWFYADTPAKALACAVAWLAIGLK